MSDSLTLPAAQWAADTDAAVTLSPLTCYVDGSGHVFATDDATNATGNTVGYLAVSSGLQLDTGLASGLAAVATPAPALLAFS